MSKKVEMLGTVWGDLTVTAPLPPENGRVMWSCKCSCGKTVGVRGDYLRSQHTTSCGDCEGIKQMKKLNLVGETFGDGQLTVLSAAGTRKGRTLWLAQCLCGSAPKVYRSDELVNGNTKSCGCKKLVRDESNIDEVNQANEERLSLTGETISGFLVLDGTGEVSKSGKLYHVSCTVCGHKDIYSQQRLRRAKKLNRPLICLGCKKAKAEAGVEIAKSQQGRLSAEQIAAAQTGLRTSVFKTAPGIAAKPGMTEEITNEGWLIVLQTAGITEYSPERLKGYAFAVGAVLTKRRFDHRGPRLKQPPKDSDGKWDATDVFDDLLVPDQSQLYGSQESDPIEAMALEVLSPEELAYALSFQSTKGWRSPESKTAFKAICQKVRDAHQELVSELEGEQHASI